MANFENKVVLVTGGSRGIGAATVRLLVTRGAKVVIHYGKSRAAALRLSQELGAANVQLLGAELESVQQTQALWEKALAWQSRIDVLVNNAGVYESNPLDSAMDDWLSGWERSLRINLVAAAQLCRYAVSHFRERGSGIVINVSSRAAHRGDSMDHWQYGASKAGMLALNRTIARHCAADGILAYGVAPGFVATDMVQPVIASKGLAEMARMYPSGRITSPEEVAEVIAFLASGVAPQTTGNTIDLSGGADVR